MRTLRRFLSRLSVSALGRRDEERLREEIAEHLAMQTAANLRAGLPADEARRQAVLKFGGVESVKEDYRDRRGLPILESVSQDVRHAIRRLRKTPAFTLTTILTLGLGIGATSAIFTLVEAILLKSLPVSKPEQLYRVGKTPHCCVWGGYNQQDGFSLVSYELYQYLRDHTQGFEEIAGFQAESAPLAVRRSQTTNAAETYYGEFVSGNYFSMFGVSGYAGRALTTADDQAASPLAAMMSYRVWQQKYGLDPSVIGGIFQVNQRAFTIVGITPPAFYGDTLKPRPPDFYLPLSSEPLVMNESSLLKKPDVHWLEMIGRTRAGAVVSSLEAQMQLELQQWLNLHAGEMTPNDRNRISKQTIFLAPGGAGISSLRREFEHWLQILMMVSGFVLLIVCANVANLMLVRGMERRQQTSLSMALGARPARIFQQALTESLILSLLGGALGLWVASAGTRLIVYFAFDRNAAFPIGSSPSVRVQLFALGISLLTGVVFGVAPAWMATRADPVEALRGASRSTRRAGARSRKALVVLQAALSLVLLSASALLTGALQTLESQDFGFVAQGRTVIHIDPVLAGYRPDQLDLLYRQIHDAFLRVPGVVSVASAMYSPLSGDSWSDRISVAGRREPDPASDQASWWARTTPGIFDVIGNPIVQGRAFSEQDSGASRNVAVINEAFGRKFFPGQNPLGKHFGRGTPKNAEDYEIIGVAKDARFLTNDLDKPPGAFFFLPESQSNAYEQLIAVSTELRSHYLHDIVVRSAPRATLTEGQARRALASVNPDLPIMRMQTMEQQVAATFSQQRLIARLTSLFGLLALVLASIGIYGITAFNAASRTGEMGVRMALGAVRRDVLVLILRSALTLIAAGLIVGLPLTLLTGKFLESQLYGIHHNDPLIIFAAMLSLIVPALAAALVPALRASSLSPMRALRSE